MLSFILSSLFAVSFAQEKIEVRSFSPQGFVKTTKQVRIEFSRAMVNFGDIGLKAPAQSECFKNGQGRWVDTRNWVFDFSENLPGGRSCEVKVLNRTFAFNTGGPHIKDIFPARYRGIDPTQNFVLMLDSSVKKESLSDGLYFVVEGLGDRIPAEILSEGPASTVKAAAEVEYKYEKENFKGEFIAIKAKRSFAPGAKVSLVWSKKIQSPTGASSPVDEVLEFNVAEAFKVEFSCDRTAPGEPCIPLLPMRLSFSYPIKVEQARKIYIQSPDQTKFFAANLSNESEKDQTSYLEFKGPFKENTNYKIVIPGNLSDEESRILTNISQFPLTVSTSENPSLLKFAADFGVVEAGPQAALAVTLRKVEKNIPTNLVGWTGRFSSKDFKNLLFGLNEVYRNPTDLKRSEVFKTHPAQMIQVAKPLKSSDMEVVGIPLPKKGFYVTEMESLLLGQSLLDKKAPFFVRSAALVTNLAVHVKHSEDEALVWVTDLQSAHAIKNATVRIYDVVGNEVATTVTDSKGLAFVPFKKALSAWPKNNQGFFYDGFFAVAEKGDDFSFVHSSWDRGIESWRFQLGSADSFQPFSGHAILDRTLLKPEETLSAKIILRKNKPQGLALPGPNEWPTQVLLSHDSGMQSFKIPLEWNKSQGAALLNWKSPAGVKMGRWTLSLEKGPSQIPVGEFSIESFRVPLIQVRLSSSTPFFVNEKKIPVQVMGTYFSGGPVMDLPMKIRWGVEPGYFSAEDDDLQDYSFANGGVQEGLFRSGEDDIARHIPQSGVEVFNLNKQGRFDVLIKNLKYGSGPQRLATEVEFKDANGEIQNIHRSFVMWPSSVVLGIKAKSWWATPKLIEFDTVALNLKQQPIQGQKIRVDLYTSRYYSHRKRLVGGFYAFEDFREVKKIGELCKGETDGNGKFSCVGSSKVGGSVLAVASAQDAQGRVSFANVNQWIIEPGQTQWFGGDDHDRADLVPFKKTYEPGEVAEFQLRTPFPESQVLVTVERDAVLYSEVVKVKGDRPMIRVPIKKEYAPNVVVSAFAIRGRLSDPQPTALVDLGKPSFKLGMANIKVGWKENTLKVNVSTDRKTYRAREKAEVVVQVTDSGGRPARDGEVAVIAVDEGLLELKDNRSWDLLTSMMRPRAHTINTATAQSLVIGKRHFGLKALPIGGDGGGAIRRELFDTLLYWNPTVKLDGQGKAKVFVPLNDSTTSFRFVAVAIQGTEQFGTGWTSVQSSQDLMILPGISGVAREGDEFSAGFTIRNASKEVQNLTVNLKTSPATAAVATSQNLILRPGEAKELHWKITVPRGQEKIEYLVFAKNDKGRILDEVKKTQKIISLRSARVVQSEWGSWPQFKELSLQQPAGAEAGKSSVLLEFADGLGGSLSSVEEFWDNYNYSCLEQQISKAVSLNDKKLWQKIEEKLGVYFDEHDLLRYFPSSGSLGSVQLTSHVLSLAHEAGFEFSEENESRMLGAVQAYAEGRLKDNVEYGRVDEVLKKVSAFETLSRYRRLNLDLLSSIDFNGTQWPTYTLVEWYQIHVWEKNTPQREKKLLDIESLLRSRFYFSAKKLQLQNEKLENMSWLMRSSESAVLRLILATVNLPSWRADLPRMYQGALSRRTNGIWYLTSDNAWGAVVIRKIQALYKGDKVQGSITASLGSHKVEHFWAKSRGAVFELPWNEAQEKLQWQQRGAGHPWVTISAKASVPITKEVFSGFKLQKTVVPVEQKEKGVWSVGDIAKVQLKVWPKAGQSWVVVEDPLPVGATVLKNSWSTAVERKEELVRFYFSWFADEGETMEYTVRFNQAGTYQVSSPRVEAMYSPDMYAVLPESVWTVKE